MLEILGLVLGCLNKARGFVRDHADDFIVEGGIEVLSELVEYGGKKLNIPGNSEKKKTVNKTVINILKDIKDSTPEEREELRKLILRNKELGKKSEKIDRIFTKKFLYHSAQKGVMH